eukprot:4650515-Pleurochrysis_carterae.AAC.1
MDSVVPPVAPLPDFDPRQVRITQTYYSLFSAAGTVEHLSIAQEGDLKNTIVILLKAFPDLSIGERASKPLLNHLSVQFEGNVPPLKPKGKWPNEKPR